MSFETPFGFIGLLAIPIIILLYILKQKRENVTVSSLVLWSQVLEDMQAQTPWQKLRRNLLMFLQILAAILIILALTGFSLNTGNVSNEPIIMVIDCSLSMASTDIKPTRLNAAKKDAIKYVDSISASTPVTVVSVGRQANVLLFSSTTKDDIKKSIESIEQSLSYADKSKAEELVLSIKKQQADAQIVLFSDTQIRFGNEQTQFSEYKKQNNNVAVVNFTHTKTDYAITAMSVVRNQGNSEAEISVTLYGDDEFIDSQWVTVPANKTKTVWWDKIPMTIKTMYVTIDTEDILMEDNSAYNSILSEEGVKALLVTEGNYFLEKVFSLIEGVELVRTTHGEQLYDGYDLYIFDGIVPKVLPEDGNIVIFAPQPNGYFQVGEWMDTPLIPYIGHSIFDYIENLSFSIGRTRIIETPLWAENVMEYNGNPIIMEGVLNNARVLIFGFDLYETDLPLKTEFPILISNIINEYAPYSGTVVNDAATLDAVQFRLNPDTVKANILLPDGKRVQIAPPIPPEVFVDTQDPGIYCLEQIKDSGNVNTFFDINIPDEWLMEENSSVSGISDIEAGHNAVIPLKTSAYKLTMLLIILAMLLILFEWWYYAKRNYI
ncbi:MAG TPA: VWA domain-containing protein [Thermoclostridium sp.]|nr:VWA domain-containing protein [Thermoclostridium sp.]